MNTVRLKAELREKVRQIARKRGITVSEVHREALEAYCDAALAEPKRSRYDDVIGIFDGPTDLSQDLGRRFEEAMVEKYGGHAR